VLAFRPVPPLHPFLRGLNAPLHIAHRGGARLFPENTLHAFRRAVDRYRTDVLELDVRATTDGEVVVFHDATLERCTDGEGELEALDWARVRRLDAAFHFTPEGGAGTPLRGAGVGVPRFEELLDTFPGLRLNVEVKSERALEPFVALLARRPGELARLCVGSEHDALGERLVARLPDACHFYPANALAALVMSVKGGEAPEDDARYTVLDLPLHWEGLTVFDRPLGEAARALGKWVNVWTVDEPQDMRRTIAEGVGGVMTDRPDLLRAVLDER
jgi:glycerophosphoryl diester phosphodiesterase